MFNKLLGLFVLHLVEIFYDLSCILFVRSLFLRHANFPPKSAAARRVTSVFVSQLLIVAASRSLIFLSNHVTALRNSVPLETVAHQPVGEKFVYMKG